MAELNGFVDIEFPADLLKTPDTLAAIDGQKQLFDNRRIALNGQKNVLETRVAELREQIIGGESQVLAYDAQLQSVVEEQASLSDLLQKELITRARTLQLQRTQDGLKGQIGAAQASIATARKTIESYKEQIAQLDRDRAAEVSKDLSDTQAKLLDVTSRLADASAVLARTQIRAPYSGQVVGLNVFGVGAVIERGEKILDIVPGAPSLMIKSKVRVDDISEIQPGMRAEVHLTSYDQRTMPLIYGTVEQISADRLTDDRTGTPYYVANVRIDQQELAKLRTSSCIRGCRRQ